MCISCNNNISHGLWFNHSYSTCHPNKPCSVHTSAKHNACLQAEHMDNGAVRPHQESFRSFLCPLCFRRSDVPGASDKHCPGARPWSAVVVLPAAAASLDLDEAANAFSDHMALCRILRWRGVICLHSDRDLGPDCSNVDYKMPSSQEYDTASGIWSREINIPAQRGGVCFLWALTDWLTWFQCAIRSQ
jgi:hypothetical protein